MPPERKEPKAPIPNAPLRVIGPSDIQQQRQIWAPVQLLYAISAGLPAHGTGNVGITEVVGPDGNAFGPVLTFAGSVTNVGNTFTFTGGGHGATTLSAPFTIPAVGATGAMSVTDGTALGQGTSILIPLGIQVDQQAWMGQVVFGGGTNSLTVLTTSLGTYVSGGTIGTGTLVTWGETATVNSTQQPTIAQTAHNTGSVGPMVMTFANTANVGDWIYAFIAVSAATTLNTPANWQRIGLVRRDRGRDHIIPLRGRVGDVELRKTAVGPRHIDHPPNDDRSGHGREREAGRVARHRLVLQAVERDVREAR